MASENGGVGDRGRAETDGKAKITKQIHGHFGYLTEVFIDRFCWIQSLTPRNLPPFWLESSSRNATSSGSLR
jgi:hypothetical protein